MGRIKPQGGRECVAPTDSGLGPLAQQEASPAAAVGLALRLEDQVLAQVCRTLQRIIPISCRDPGPLAEV